MVRVALLALILGLLGPAPAALAADHRVEASARALRTLLASGRVGDGDRVLLESGGFGAVDIDAGRLARSVTLAAAPGAQPVLDQLVLRDARGWRVEGLTVRPEGRRVPKGALVQVLDGRDVVLEGLTVSSAASADGWSAATWRERARTGIAVSGHGITVRDSRVSIVDHGILAGSTGTLVENNTVTLFSGDGMRGLGDDSVYRGNRIETCVKVDDNHDDGFQSYSTDAQGRAGRGVVRNVRIENNVILNGSHPLACTLQGIGLFDGIYEDWTIAGNVVVVNHVNGIVVRGAVRVTISDNIVVDAVPGKPGPPFIAIRDHKDGRVPVDSVMARNVSQYSAEGRTIPGVRLIDNRMVPNAEAGLALRRQ